MSHNALPITPQAFAHALTSLTLPSLHSESLRLQNSIYHLRRSNLSLEHCLLDPSLPADDQREFRDAIRENEEVIKRQEERIELVKQEVERRGFRMPHEGEAGAEVGVEVEVERREGEEGTRVNGVLGDGSRNGEERVNGVLGREEEEEEEEETTSVPALAPVSVSVAEPTITATAPATTMTTTATTETVSVMPAVPPPAETQAHTRTATIQASDSPSAEEDNGIYL